MNALVYIFAFLATALVGCTPWQAKYLASVSGRASQDEVAKRMGAPNGTYSLKSGGQVWSYDNCYGSMSGDNGHASGGFRCDKYVLSFDERGTLRNWERQR
jgi:hypothetical protein